MNRCGQCGIDMIYHKKYSKTIQCCSIKCLMDWNEMRPSAVLYYVDFKARCIVNIKGGLNGRKRSDNYKNR